MTLTTFTTSDQLARIREQKQALEIAENRLLENVERHWNENDDERAKRLRYNLVRTGKREVRARLTGKRSAGKSEPAHDVFEYIYERWRGQRAGFRGVEIGVEQIAKVLRYTPQHVRRLLRRLEQTKLIIVFGRGGRGKPNRYAVTLPETDTYLEIVQEAAMISLAKQGAFWPGPEENPNIDSIENANIESRTSLAA